jgi:hypothetical protein
MNDTLKIANHLSSGEVRLRMRMSGGFLRLQKWLVVYNAIVDPRPVSEIARHTGLSEGTVRRVIDEYNSLGPDSLENGTETGGTPRGVAGRIRSLFACSA